MEGNALKEEQKGKGGEKARTLRLGEERTHFEMLNLCFDPWGSQREWKRRYVLYPDFDVAENVVTVERDGEWAGGGTAWFRHALMKKNARAMVYCAGDLYTHPDHRGRGVFSTAMRGLNQLARRKGAALGFAFPPIYSLAATALHKYGFVRVFYPTTHVAILKPKGFFQFLISRAKKAIIPEKFNGIKLRLRVSFDTLNGKHVIDETFQVENGRISEFRNALDKEPVDLTVRAEIGSLLKIVCSFYFGKMALIRSLLAALLKGHVSVRFSTRFIRSFLGL